jgi:hypothetical protein
MIWETRRKPSTGRFHSDPEQGCIHDRAGYRNDRDMNSAQPGAATGGTALQAILGMSPLESLVSG